MEKTLQKLFIVQTLVQKFVQFEISLKYFNAYKKTFVDHTKVKPFYYNQSFQIKKSVKKVN